MDFDLRVCPYVSMIETIVFIIHDAFAIFDFFGLFFSLKIFTFGSLQVWSGACKGHTMCSRLSRFSRFSHMVNFNVSFYRMVKKIGLT